jgi:hypothetical protein
MKRTENPDRMDPAQIPTRPAQPPWAKWLGYTALLLLSLTMTASFLRPNQCPPPDKNEPKTSKELKISTIAHPQMIHSTTTPKSGAPDPPLGTDADWYVAWQIDQWIFSQHAEMSAAMCEEWVAFLQSKDVFFALRYPASSLALTNAQPEAPPVVFDPPYTPTLILEDTRIEPVATFFTIPLELRPERQAFLDSELPSAPGEQWLALGLETDPVADCSGVPDLAAGEWQFIMDFLLDLHDRPQWGMGEVLPLYYCYEGQAPPFFFLVSDQVLSGDEVTSGQGQGITYMGPQPVRLVTWFDPPRFELHGTNTIHISPTDSISLSHFMVNTRSTPLTVTFDYSSTLNAAWDIVTGTIDGPHEPLTPIADPFTLPPLSEPLDRTYFWMLSQVPEDTAAGAYTLIITATDVMSRDLNVQTSDLLWVGEWVAPSQKGDNRVYLPIVVRSTP